VAAPVQPILNEGHLRLLMSEQHESERLDYKRELDLVGPNRRRNIIELAKDVAAMASGLGGYLGIGLNERGKPTGLLTVEQARELDEARLRQRLERYLPDGIDLRSAVHEIDRKLVGLIYVGAHPDGLVVFRTDGIYQGNRRQIVVFREGDIFVRRGTQSRRMSQRELRSWMREQARRMREEAMGAHGSQSADVLHQRVHRAINALDDWRQFGQQLRNGLTGGTSSAPLHVPRQTSTAILRMFDPPDAAGKVQQWTYETLVVVQQHTIGEEGRFLSDQGLPEAGDTDPVSVLDRRLHRLEEIIAALRAPGSERMVPND
jgi:hypothetical protein